MSDLKLQENQQELFTGFTSEPRRTERIPSIAKTQKPILLSTTLEQIFLIVIVLILIFCLVFFLGVLRGRSIAATATVTRPIQAPAAIPVVSKPPLVIRQAVTVASKKTNSFLVMKETSTKPYTIQVLTTKKKAYSESEVSLLKKTGFVSWMIQSGDYYVVCVGFYANKEEARRDLVYFGSRYKGSYLRRR